ncbi:MAG: hypothetical protein CSA33_00885 [Desulfobulbus propionicus]|nr:MAG: hypothetical protein CSA33_00885 [Desulfobulbus propionicus]
MKKVMSRIQAVNSHTVEKPFFGSHFFSADSWLREVDSRVTQLHLPHLDLQNTFLNRNTG